MSGRPFVIAHRGAPRERHENSLASILRARDLGADRIEIDVRSTRDGAVVLHHDDDLRRSAGALARVEDLELAALRELPLHFGGTEGSPTATLEEALEAAGPVPLVVEVKAPRAAEGEAVAAAAATARAVLDRLGRDPPHALISFAEAAVRVALERLPPEQAGLIRNTEYPPRARRAALALPARLAVLSRRIATPALCDALLSGGLSLWLYALDTPAQLRAGLARGATGLITNVPGLARRFLDAR